MNILDVILIGIALSMDACALTIANCATYGKNLTKKNEWSMPIAFAIFQGVMPLIGYFVGSTFADSIKGFSGYVTFGIFFILAMKIVFDIVKEQIEKNKIIEVDKNAVETQKYTYGILIVQAIATSLDALFIGVTLPLELTFSVYIAVVIIMVITFILVTIALLFGKYLGKLFGKYAEYVGAIILFILAVKKLIEAIAW